jgi:hypothetical protein
MEKEFGTYEQALALKELGFDEECFGEWLNLKIGKYLRLNEEDSFWNITSLSANIKAPLKQQIFRWFRENGFEYNIMKDHSDLNRGYFYDIWLGVKFIIETDYIFTTYEEAENACIDKLIEVAKQQSNG